MTPPEGIPASTHTADFPKPPENIGALVISKQNESERHFRVIFNFLLSVLPTLMDSSPWVSFGHQLQKGLEGSTEVKVEVTTKMGLSKAFYVNSLHKQNKTSKILPLNFIISSASLHS